MILLYDGSFEGFLSTIFEIYTKKLIVTDICALDHYQEVMFSEKIFIATHTEHANRVWAGWQKKLSKSLDQLPFLAFLSAQPGIELSLYQFARQSFNSEGPIEGNFSDQDILEIRMASRRVTQVAMRMMQFIRFQRTKDQIYFAGIKPRYDVLPLILKHFKDRFADQQWLIYDMKRDYGFFYNSGSINEVMLNDKTFNSDNGKIPIDILEENEHYYQEMWSNYCKKITIKERMNLKLQKQHMPRRYWKFLTEIRI